MVVDVISENSTVCIFFQLGRQQSTHLKSQVILIPLPVRSTVGFKEALSSTGHTCTSDFETEKILYLVRCNVQLQIDRSRALLLYVKSFGKLTHHGNLIL